MNMEKQKVDRMQAHGILNNTTLNYSFVLSKIRPGEFEYA